MPRKFRAKLRLRAGGVLGEDNSVTGGVVIGHFTASYELSVDRPTLTSRVSNGPTVQDVDDDDDTCTLRIEAEQDSVEARNMQNYAVVGGYVGVVSADALDTAILTRYGPFKWGPFGASGRKESSTESATLVGTNRIREAAWITANVTET